MATEYFKNFPEMQYKLDSGKIITIKDFFRKATVDAAARDAVIDYTFHELEEGDRPDVLATKLYGNGDLHWTFFLVNENLQDFNDWPKSQVTFNKFISRKYSGTCLLASSTTDIVSFNHDTEVSSKFLLGEKVSQSSDIFGFVTDVNPTFNRITLNSVQGTFTNDSTVTGVDSNKSFTVSSVVREQDAVNHYLDSNNLNRIDTIDGEIIDKNKDEL